ncbi:MAG TPA: BatD family protein [Phycisphaerae bacterium]|nr:BatD family protein [Phycisphaerae bacterium]
MRRPTRLAAMLCLLSVVGCGPGEPASDRQGEIGEPAYSRQSSGGPVRIRMLLDATEIGLADQVVLTQELEGDPGFEADLPDYLPEDFGHFAVVDMRQDSPVELADGGVLQRRQFVLEPERTGTLTIAPMYVYFREEGKERDSHFVTEPIEVQVAPVTDVAGLQLRPTRDIFRADPEAPEERGWFGWVLAVVVLVVATAIYVRRRRVQEQAPITPPHELAREALQRLIERDLIAKGQVEQFFVELSSIMREYIERRFGIHAPDRTTEEFLVEASRSDALTGHHRRLRQFLTLADQVKFAVHRPAEEDTDESIHVLKRFVQETASDAV